MICYAWSLTVKHPDGTEKTVAVKCADGLTEEQARAHITHQQTLYNEVSKQYYMPQGEITKCVPRDPRRARPKAIEAEHKLDKVTEDLAIRTVVMPPKTRKPFNE
jgi:hypothetical protein